MDLDAALRARLHNLNQPLELCDESGRVLARIMPVFDVSEWRPVSADVSEEELYRREQPDEWYTTEEVLASLKGLEKQ